MTPSPDAVAAIAKLAASSNAEVAKAAQQVGSLWGDASSVKAALARLNDASASEADRLAAIATARKLKSDDSRNALLKVALGNSPDTLRVAAVRGLTEVGADDTARQLLAQWSSLTPTLQRAVAELCTTRGNWKWPFYSAVERGEIKRGDLPPTVIRALATSKNDAERKKAQQLFGRVNASSADKLKVIAAKRQVVVEGPSRTDAEVTTGRTRQNKLVHFAAPPLRVGTLASVEVTRAGGHSLRGELREVLAASRHRTRIPVVVA